MIIKKFQAKTETEAIMLAQEDLGSNAIVMNIKTIKPTGLFKMFRKTIVEVTAAIDENNAKPVEAKEIEPKSSESKISENKTSKTKTSERKVNDRVVSAQVDVSIDDKLHSETATQEEKEAEELEKKLNSLAQLIEQQIEEKTTEKSNAVSSNRNTERKKNRKKEDKKKENKKEEIAVEKSAGTESEPKEIKTETPIANESKVEEIKEVAEPVSEKDKLRNKSINLIIEQLTNNEVTYAYAQSIMDEITHTGAIRTLEDMLSCVYQKIILKIGQTKPIQNTEDKKPQIVFFMGPTGVGKTTTIAKLSSKLTLEDNKKIAILTADTYRIAAVEQIKTYANILSMPIEVIYETTDLDKIISKYKKYDYIMVDTAGRSHKSKDQFDDLKKLFKAFSKYNVLSYLVLSATTKYKDLKRITSLYEDIDEYSLIFTKLDETDAVGNILNIRLETGMSLSYVSYGQNVPDDIEVLNPQTIAKQLLGGADGYGSSC